MWHSIYLALLLGLLAKTGVGQCSVLNERSSTQELVSFLRTSLDQIPAQRNSHCIEFALRHLEHKSSPQTAELVSHYLDFERPLSQAEREGFMIHGPMNEADMHPAIGTLMTFGKAAIPTLLFTIADSQSPVTSRNATHAIMEIYRDQPTRGIELLKQEAAISRSPGAEKLREAAGNAVQWCSDRYRQQCKASVKQ